jgi:hypothetical protein
MLYNLNRLKKGGRRMKKIIVMILGLVLGGCVTINYQSSFGFGARNLNTLLISTQVFPQPGNPIDGKKVEIEVDMWRSNWNPTLNDVLITVLLKWGANIVTEKGDFVVKVNASDKKTLKVVSLELVNLATGQTITTGIGEAKCDYDITYRTQSREQRDYYAFCTAIVQAVAGMLSK